jgi:hypothetical protein
LVSEFVVSDKTLPGPGVVRRRVAEYANSAFDILVPRRVVSEVYRKSGKKNGPQSLRLAVRLDVNSTAPYDPQQSTAWFEGRMCDAFRVRGACASNTTLPRRLNGFPSQSCVGLAVLRRRYNFPLILEVTASESQNGSRKCVRHNIARPALLQLI